MRIADEIAKSVGFVSRSTELLRYGGTAFIVEAPIDEKHGMLHLVTAKHVADAVGADCVIGMNGMDGLPLFAKTEDAGWFYHPTEPGSVDAAVLPFASLRIVDYDISPIPLEIFATRERISAFDIGLGDEVFTVGLFTRYFGRTSLIPIVRTGNIAMMPTERVPLGPFGLAEVYLVEGRSIGGLSGSPVFCRDTTKMRGIMEQGQASFVTGVGQIHFLGLVHGHWDLPREFEDGEQVEVVNMGISIAIPATKIMEILFSPALVKLRAEAANKI